MPSKWPEVKPVTVRQLMAILDTVDDKTKTVRLQIGVMDTKGTRIVSAETTEFNITERNGEIQLWRDYGNGVQDAPNDANRRKVAREGAKLLTTRLSLNGLISEQSAMDVYEVLRTNLLKMEEGKDE